MSVIVPLYNEGERVLALLDHLRALHGLAEAVLVDASDDAASMTVVDELAATHPVIPVDKKTPHLVIPEGRETRSDSAYVSRLSGISRPRSKDCGGDGGMGRGGDGSADDAPAKKNAGVAALDVAPVIRLLRVDAPGRARQMNAGAAACAGDVLLFLHCDTRLPRRAAARIDAAVARGHRWGWFDLKLDARGILYRVIERMICLRARATGIATGDMALFIERRLFAAEGGFADMPLMEDVEFSRRLKRAGRPAVIADRVTTSARRWQQNGVARTVFLMWKLRFGYWRGRDPARLAAAYHNVRDDGDAG